MGKIYFKYIFWSLEITVVVTVRRELIKYKNYLDTYVTISILEIIFTMF